MVRISGLMLGSNALVHSAAMGVAENLLTDSWDGCWHNPIIRRCVRLQSWAMIVYYPMEHAAWAATLAPNLFKPLFDVDRLWRVSCYFWVIWLLLDVLGQFCLARALALPPSLPFPLSPALSPSLPLARSLSRSLSHARSVSARLCSARLARLYDLRGVVHHHLHIRNITICTSGISPSTHHLPVAVASGSTTYPLPKAVSNGNLKPMSLESDSSAIRRQQHGFASASSL
jgi:hypothetical protein